MKIGITIAVAILLVILSIACFQSPETFKKTANGAAAVAINQTELFYQSNFLVEDLKAKYIKGYNSAQTLKEQLIKVMAQKRVNDRKYEQVTSEMADVCKKLKSIDFNSSNYANEFSKLKAQYDSLTVKTNTLYKALVNYESSITNLNFTINKINVECEKLKYKIDEVETTVEMCKNLKELNNIISINNEDFSAPVLNTDNLNKDLEFEQAKLEVLIEKQAAENEVKQISTESEMKMFVENL